MAIVRCPECKKEISDKADSCPNCGFKKTKPKQIGCGTVIVLILFLTFVVGVYNDTNAPSAPKTAEQIRAERLRIAFSPVDGSHYGFIRNVKKNLKDPDSFAHIKTTHLTEKDKIKLSMTYRAKNSFGGYVVNDATATANLDGEIIGLDMGSH